MAGNFASHFSVNFSTLDCHHISKCYHPLWENQQCKMHVTFLMTKQNRFHSDRSFWGKITLSFKTNLTSD